MSHQAEAQAGKPPHLEGAPERHRAGAGVGELPGVICWPSGIL